MSARSDNRPTENVLQKNFVVPIQTTEISNFDSDFSSMKERFVEEMKRIEDEMSRFSSNLIQLYARVPSEVVPGSRPTSSPTIATNWESITSSPLVEGEGDSRTLKLQFDVSQFDTEEINVKIIDNVLLISAVHEERSENNTVYREYQREFYLPKGIEPETVESALSRDGILTIQVPLLANVIANKAATRK